MLLKTRTLSTLVLAIIAATPILHAQWTVPTKDELSMTSVPEVAGAPAVILYKEQTTDDTMGVQNFYYRIKVLSEKGKDYANVELPYSTGGGAISLDSIMGRTIQPDGTITPFTGKPYEKTITKGDAASVRVKVFTLPNVQIGSILEYRFKFHLDQMVESPDWYLQGDLFVRKAHYMWRPSSRDLIDDHDNVVSATVAYTPLLPPGVTVKQTNLSGGSMAGHAAYVELVLDVNDVMPLVHEQYMPPLQSQSYRVLFYYTQFHTPREFWTSEGKRWSKTQEKFISAGPAVQAQLHSVVSASDTPEQKLRKIYAYVMTIENTDFTRERSTSEDRASGLREIKTADDIVARKRGSGDQINAVFVAMARAAGMKAYVMSVADRRSRVFLPNYLNMRQLDDDITIVNLGGKDIFLDPGSRYCTFGQLSWRHALTEGLRQTDGGVDVTNTPGSSYKDSHVNRVADLTLDDHGEATGTVRMTYTGDYALAIRQDALRGDAVSLNHELRTRMERTLPGGMEVKVGNIENLTDPDQPLKVFYDVKGAVGTPTGKRLLVPATLFEINSKPRFPEARRELAIDMHYAGQMQDAVRYILPGSLTIESAPAEGKAGITGAADFNTSSKTTPNSITIYRNLTMGKTFFAAASYGDLRDFYTKVETKDQEPVVLTRSSVAAKPDAGGN